MKILLTGASGYIGKRLLPELLLLGHEVYCGVRDLNRFNGEQQYIGKVYPVKFDLLDKQSLFNIPKDIDIAYYLVHSMSSSTRNFNQLEEQAALNFVERMNETSVKQVIYLSGIANDKNLSKHLSSRERVADIISDGKYFHTILRAGIIVGSGSASFEIIRDLVEKLPIMVAPKWLKTKTQPIAIRNVIAYLKGVINLSDTFNKSYDIGGPDVLNYKQMLLRFAKVRGLKRLIYSLPIMTPKLSSYWLYFVTSTSYKLAINLVDSMKVEVICQPNDLHKLLGIQRIGYDQAIELAFSRIEQDNVLSSWTDAQSTKLLKKGISEHILVPQHGCYTDKRQGLVSDYEYSLNKFWSIGGHNGWYYGNWLWNVRGFIDKVFGGVGIRRGRRSDGELMPGDSLDFWRVIYANKNKAHLLLYAEMKLPGEAWLEFKIRDGFLYQTATYRPLGLWGRLYWYAVLPFHAFIFKGLLKNITNK